MLEKSGLIKKKNPKTIPDFTPTGPTYHIIKCPFDMSTLRIYETHPLLQNGKSSLKKKNENILAKQCAVV